MKQLARTGALLVLLLASVVGIADAAGLRGSPRSMQRQHAVAVDEAFVFLRTAASVHDYVARGQLLRIESGADVTVSPEVTYPYARPEAKLFIERLGAEYRAATGEPLVVTSLVRPTSEQPRNAHPLSVHPAGIAVDLRVPARARSRAWLERTLLALEGDGVLDVTRERQPPHYHVAVFPAEYVAHVAAQSAADAAAALASTAVPAVAPVVTVATPGATSVNGVQPAAAPPLASLPEQPLLRAHTLFDEQPLALPILGAATAAVLVLAGVGVAARVKG